MVLPIWLGRCALLVAEAVNINDAARLTWPNRAARVGGRAVAELVIAVLDPRKLEREAIKPGPGPFRQTCQQAPILGTSTAETTGTGPGSSNFTLAA